MSNTYWFLVGAAIGFVAPFLILATAVFVEYRLKKYANDRRNLYNPD